jgi:hypothetical protein
LPNDASTCVFRKEVLMRKTNSLCSSVVSSLAMVLLAGCSSNPASTSNVATSPPVTPPPPATPQITGTNVYVVQSGRSPSSILVFPQVATGLTLPTLEITGSQVSVDGNGNIYLFTGTSIDEYSASSPTGAPLRYLPLGPMAKINGVNDVMATATGEIFVSDGKGIAAFSPTATGDADPVRYIVPQPAEGSSTPIIPGLIAVDNSDNVYVQNLADSSIVVFGPTDNGNVVPTRTIAGALTRLNGQGSSSYINAMATDTLGNLYVMCLCAPAQKGGSYDFGVFEFAPVALGNVAPIRFVTSPEMYPYTSDGNGIAVDSAGTIYVSAGTTSGTQALFEFSSSASGRVAPSNTVTLSGWDNTPPSRIAVH